MGEGRGAGGADQGPHDEGGSGSGAGTRWGGWEQGSSGAGR